MSFSFSSSSEPVGSDDAVDIMLTPASKSLMKLAAVSLDGPPLSSLDPAASSLEPAADSGPLARDRVFHALPSSSSSAGMKLGRV